MQSALLPLTAMNVLLSARNAARRQRGGGTIAGSHEAPHPRVWKRSRGAAAASRPPTAPAPPSAAMACCADWWLTAPPPSATGSVAAAAAAARGRSAAPAAGGAGAPSPALPPCSRRLRKVYRCCISTSFTAEAKKGTDDGKTPQHAAPSTSSAYDPGVFDPILVPSRGLHGRHDAVELGAATVLKSDQKLDTAVGENTKQACRLEVGAVRWRGAGGRAPGQAPLPRRQSCSAAFLRGRCGSACPSADRVASPGSPPGTGGALCSCETCGSRGMAPTSQCGANTAVTARHACALEQASYFL